MNGLYVMNTFFQKRETRKWIWVHPGGTMRNEIDYVISSHKHVVTDVSVLSSFKAGSDHRLVRARLRFDFNSERTKMIKTTSKRDQDSFQIDLKNRFECIDELNLDVDHIN
ncbi:craniofacial development protein 2-like [Hyposmocoma kahamanoa]|uniref:craniofacial development protein 2-like n=1 Tax=Hyposmocoma kahamanoa TaxID=1477025 RepID=UPI000E6D8F47|nr:craniofacial development protein 2-like [Hyposmocoma kahamanoa]